MRVDARAPRYIVDGGDALSQPAAIAPRHVECRYGAPTVAGATL